MKATAILGSGPAAMAAAWAVAMSGRPIVVISSTDEPMRIGGAQYLHRGIPNVEGAISVPDMRISYERWGDPKTYQDKVYGSTPPKFSSWERVQDDKAVPAWSLRKSYEHLFRELTSNGDRVNKQVVDVQYLVDNLLTDSMFEMVISTIPRNVLCTGGCQFSSVDIKMVRGRYYPTPSNTIIYNGDPDYSWVRSSNIDGEEWTEFGASVEDRIPADEEAIMTVSKPVSHSCKCWDEEPKMFFTGRFGRWLKGELVDDAFYNTWKMLQERS